MILLSILIALIPIINAALLAYLVWRFIRRSKRSTFDHWGRRR